jgi:hypothetical protein
MGKRHRGHCGARQGDRRRRTDATSHEEAVAKHGLAEVQRCSTTGMPSPRLRASCPLVRVVYIAMFKGSFKFFIVGVGVHV